MTRWIRTALAAAVLCLGPALMTRPAVAFQDPNAPVAPEGEGSSKGDPMYGYVGTAFLAAGVMFVVGKSARR